LSTIFSSNVSPAEAFRIFSKFGEFKEVGKEMRRLVSDIDLFGIDVHTALERASERTPSKRLQEIFWGLLTTLRTGANVPSFLREKSRSLIEEYRRQVLEFSKTLSLYIEIYLTAIIIGTIFFTVLTSVMSGIIGGGSGLIASQFLMIFIGLPAITAIFIYLIRSSYPGEV